MITLNRPLSRRHFTLLSAAGLAAAAFPGPRALARASASERVICYTSADSVYAKVLFAEFTKATGIKVDAVYDTEATKTTGLVQRLLNEKDGAGASHADVWWSSEPFGTIKLARAGVLDRTTIQSAETRLKPHGGWPAYLRASDLTWYGFGCRARVFVYNTKFVDAEDAPRTAEHLLNPAFKDRVAIAKPQFGTTRGHFGALVERFGERAFEHWLEKLKDHGVRIVDGNAAVVAAVARGECRVGLTDTDDVYAGQREGWPVAISWEYPPPVDAPPGGWKRDGLYFGALGPMLIPNTASIVKGGKNAAAAYTLVEYLLSPQAQRSLAETDSHNQPVDPDLRKEFAKYDAKHPAELDLYSVADKIDAAMAICAKVLG